MGIVSASADPQLSGRARGGGFTLLELPRILRDQWGMSVLDLNTSSFPDFTTVNRSYLDRLRDAAREADCQITNLKMNQRGWDLASPDRELRRQSVAEYKRSIDIAAQLGCRWARPLPSSQRPDLEVYVDSYRELCDHAGERGVTMLVENFGWMQADADSVVDLVRQIGRNVAAGVDTGNWDSQELRDRGLRRTFPIAVTCDFKARRLGPRGEHEAYDLKQCFEIAWHSGYRGPWCFEHANLETERFFAEIAMLRDMLQRWTDELSRASQPVAEP